MLKNFFLVDGDSFVYGEIGKNLLLHGQFALGGVGDKLDPTLIRLPGYPFFLALCFRVFGMENYASAAWVQIPLELVGCLFLADFARRIAPAQLRSGAAHCTLWVAALCPFTAIYSAMPMAEALTLFAISLALWSVARFQTRPGWGYALSFAFAVTYAALLRPDGALVAVALAPALLIGLWRREGKQEAVDAILPPEKPVTIHTFQIIRMAAVCLLLALTPFVIWTVRNWQVFHLFQPLAPRFANDPGQETYPGWERWVKTWSLDYVSTYNVYWEVPGSPLELNALPGRAFDSAEQYAETVDLVADYNVKGQARDLVPELDARFGKLADERISAHPLRYYLWLPLGRVADMWLRPRVENLPIDLDWWVYSHHRKETRFCWAYAGLNALYLVLAAAGIWLRPRNWHWMVAYLVMRSGLLLSVAAPEARYTLECFPMLFVLSGIGLCEGWRRFAGRLHIQS
jgi:hypothetical protein